ncbi:DEAD/DEAH box helicase [Brachybacterium saurashtrense]|uniref:ATP-dependent helicase n=1 Tax=Brachybacterium saurashtrense TaxID=556288 RepID=A0A345YLJ3_9MICO|nr:DEAD/DEAH box helicase [Brachybacterium saurashtrense]AXK44795.1 ATP-dependent helicase [Brachybacterium saurashtrense]RRR23407.1 ATP-dependent helicase [Brachybacterium saurashtrense]
MPKARRRSAHRSERFEDMALPDEVLAVLAEQGLERAFEIQSAILPDALAGRDVLARAETGSGKTLAFTLAMTSRFRGRKVHRRRPLGVVLVPTRELAVQVVDTIHPFARAVGTSAQLVAGGMNIEKQADAVARGVGIVVATPGRLIDLAERGALQLDLVESTVIDEADHMADLGFLPDVRDILAAIPMGTQKMLFSATLDGQVEQIVDSFLVDPVSHETTPVTAAVKSMDHHVLEIAPAAKREVTAQLAAREGRTLLFTRTQLGAERVAQELIEVGVPAAALHGSKQQGLRTNVLAGFRQGAFPVLVATDVAARGLHIDDVSMVVHVDPSDDVKEYVHRSGRTARAGAAGSVVTLALPHQVSSTRRILAGAEVEPQRAEEVDSASHEALAALGGRTPAGEPVEDPATVKYKGAPRKLDLGGRRGADARRAEERRANEERRASWEDGADERPGRGGPGGGGGARGSGGSRGSGGRGEGGRGAGGRGADGRGGSGSGAAGSTGRKDAGAGRGRPGSGGAGKGRGRSGAPRRRGGR